MQVVSNIKIWLNCSSMGNEGFRQTSTIMWGGEIDLHIPSDGFFMVRAMSKAKQDPDVSFTEFLPYLCTPL